MVNFFFGLELSRRIQCSEKEKDQLLIFIRNTISLAYEFSEHGYEAIRDKLNEPTLSFGLGLIESGASILSAEKILKYRLLTSENRGKKFLEKLISTEAILSTYRTEHPTILMYRLFSYLGEKYSRENGLFLEMRNVSQKRHRYTEYFAGLEKSEKPPLDFLNLHPFHKILEFDQRQKEFLLLDLNPFDIAYTLQDLEDYLKKPIYFALSRETAEMVKYASDWIEKNPDRRKSFQNLITSRMKGIEPNSIELRKAKFPFSLLPKGEDFLDRLKLDSGEKSKLIQLVVVLMSVASSIREKGFLESRVILSQIDDEKNPFLKFSLGLVLDGYSPQFIQDVLEKFILSDNAYGFEFVRSLFVLEGCIFLSRGATEEVILDYFLQTLGEEYREKIEVFIDEMFDK